MANKEDTLAAMDPEQFKVYVEQQLQVLRSGQGELQQKLEEAVQAASDTVQQPNAAHAAKAAADAEKLKAATEDSVAQKVQDRVTKLNSAVLKVWEFSKLVRDQVLGKQQEPEPLRPCAYCQFLSGSGLPCPQDGGYQHGEEVQDTGCEK